MELLTEVARTAHAASGGRGLVYPHRTAGGHRHHRLLISILLPALRKAREAEIRMACLGNLKQTFTGFSAYGNDFGDYPTNFSSTAGTAGDGSEAGGTWLDTRLM